jgi:hypothetical protein
LELYHANAKKRQDPDLPFEFAVIMVEASKTLPVPKLTPAKVEKAIDKREDFIEGESAKSLGIPFFIYTHDVDSTSQAMSTLTSVVTEVAVPTPRPRPQQRRASAHWPHQNSS